MSHHSLLMVADLVRPPTGKHRVTLVTDSGDVITMLRGLSPFRKQQREEGPPFLSLRRPLVDVLPGGGESGRLARSQSRATRCLCLKKGFTVGRKGDFGRRPKKGFSEWSGAGRSCVGPPLDE